MGGSSGLGALYQHRELIRAFARREIQSRYRGSLGGLFYTVLHPLLLLALYTFVFGWILRVRLGAEVGTSSFPLFLLVGLLPWHAVQEGLSRSATVLLEHPTLVKRTPFPTEILPVSVALSSLVTQLVATTLVVAVLALQGRLPGLPLLAFPGLLALQVAMTLGLGWALASLNVFVRDVGQLLGIGLTLWLFLTPILYPPTLLPAAARPLLLANPLALLVEAHRAVLIRNQWPDPAALLLLVASSAVLLSVGDWLFRRLQPGFADVV